MADKTLIMKEAQKYILKGQIDKAIFELEKLIKEAPDGNTYNSIGDLYLKKGDKKSAVQYHHKAAEFFRQDGFSLKALALYKKVLNTNPGDIDALYALGQLSEEKSLITDSIKFYLAAADCVSKEGEKDRLIEIYAKILTLSPGNMPLRTKIAEIYLKEGFITNACKEYISIAGSYDEKGDADKARVYYQKVLDIQPSSKEAVLGIARLFEKTGDIDKAISYLRKASETYPDDAAIMFRYCELLMLKGRVNDAKECILKIRESDPGNMKARQLLADMYLKSGDKQKAWGEYLPLIDQMIYEEKHDNAVNLLELFRDVDPLETGRRLVTFTRQVHDDDRLVSELMNLGGVYEERGLIDEARECYREASEVKPDDEDLRRKLREISAEPEPEPVAGPELETVEEPELETVEEPELEIVAGPEEETEETETIKIVSGAEKTADEIFVEADIFSRYGLLNEAIRLLEGLKVREPHNIDVHLRLKTVYFETADAESAVTECLILNELYKRNGDLLSADKALQDAFEISPRDPRLESRAVPPMLEQTAYSPSAPELTGAADEAAGIEDYEDSIAEADFYIRQGLPQEASKILEKMHSLFPENQDIIERLENLGVITETFEPAALPLREEVEAQQEETGILPEEIVLEETGAGPEGPVPGTEEAEFEPAAAGPSVPEAPVTWELTGEQPEISPDLTPGPSEITAGQSELTLPKAEEEPPAESEYEDLMLTEQDLVDAQEMPELALDSDVLEVFQEFKRGLEKELGDEDSETHYNLGIAYKEMGLVDDAIKEFQSARNDPKRVIQSSTMLGVCYMEKGLYSLAIEVLSKVASEGTEKDESYWPIRYDLAEAYEKNNNLKEALDLYTAVYGWNARFRSVSEKLSLLKAQIAKSGYGDKPVKPEKQKEKKDRVSYL